jgi:hypothetical protein
LAIGPRKDRLGNCLMAELGRKYLHVFFKTEDVGFGVF